MAYDSYLSISNGIEGESTAKNYEKWVKVDSYSLSAQNPATVGSGTTGLSSGRTSVSNLSVSFNRGKETPQVFKFMASGEHIDKLVLHLTKNVGKTGAVQQPFEIYTFDNCICTFADMSGMSGQDEPSGALSFAFAKVTVKYQQQDTKGGVIGKPVEASFDQTTVEVS